MLLLKLPKYMYDIIKFIILLLLLYIIIIAVWFENTARDARFRKAIK